MQQILKLTRLEAALDGHRYLQLPCYIKQHMSTAKYCHQRADVKALTAIFSRQLVHKEKLQLAIKVHLESDCETCASVCVL